MYYFLVLAEDYAYITIISWRTPSALIRISKGNIGISLYVE